MKIKLIARKGSLFTFAGCCLLFFGLSFVVAETKAGESAQKNSATNPPAATTESGQQEAKAVSNTLLAALEEKLTSLKNEADLAQRLLPDSGVAAFINQRIELLERMLVLVEQRQSMQATVDAYQKQLNDLQQKISASAKISGDAALR